MVAGHLLCVNPGKQPNLTKPVSLSRIDSAYPICRASNRMAGMWGRVLPHLACLLLNKQDFLHPGGSAGKESACNARDLGLNLGLGRSPGEGKGYPLQHPGVENSMDCIVSPWGLKKSDTTEQLSLSLFTWSRTELAASTFKWPTTILEWFYGSWFIVSP